MKTVIGRDVFFGPGTDVDELDPRKIISLERGCEVRTLEHKGYTRGMCVHFLVGEV